jgi:hypothetical protein
MKRWLVFPALILVLAACGGSDGDTERPTQLVVVTGAPEVEALQGTIAAHETREAATAAASGVVVAGQPSATPQIIAQGVVIDGDAIVFANAEADATEIGLLPQDTIVNISGQTEPNRIGVVFYHIQFEALDGWVASTQISLADQAVQAQPTLIPPTEGVAVQPSPAISLTPSNTPTPSQTPTSTASPTPPPTFTPTATATRIPSGFPTPEIYSVAVVEQLFEHGRMVWIQPLRQIWVLSGEGVDPTRGEWSCYPDEFLDGMVERDPQLDPPPGTTIITAFEGAVPMQPVRGFGMIWRENPSVRASLGWAYTHETLHTTRYEYHADGEIGDDDEFQQAPGEYHIDSLFQYTLVLNEASLRAPCDEIDGTWRIILE